MNTKSMIKTDIDSFDVIVVGAGAAGMMASAAAAGTGVSVCMLDKNPRPGAKMLITGKGRCNITNDCDTQTFLGEVIRNPRFIYSAMAGFSTQDTKHFFESRGVPLKTERGRRVFPVSDRSGDIVAAMEKECRVAGVRFEQARVTGLISDANGIRGVKTDQGSIYARAVILATGGMSYPRTGSTGDGYAFCRSLGHTVTELSPSLIPLVCEGSLFAEMQGLSLKNVTLSLTDGQTGKVLFKDLGEMMFTHFGLSGPLVLSASAYIPHMERGRYSVSIDLKPALNEQTLDTRIQSDFKKYANKDFCHTLSDLLPAKMIDVIVRLSGIPEHLKAHEIKKEQRQELVRLLKNLRFEIRGFRPLEEAVVTRGGIAVSEINPKTMESKICKGLYLSGEMIDVDAFTGGYNLQIALSTGRLAGLSAAAAVRQE